MTMNPLPPQAYTKDTLLKAYQWMQAQPPSIREMAMTPDILVSLFLKASRDGDQSLDRPSIQNFKTELKNLAGMMGELDPPKNPSGQFGPRVSPPPAGASHHSASPSSALPQNRQLPNFHAPTPNQNVDQGSVSPSQASQTQGPPPGWNQFLADAPTGAMGPTHSQSSANTHGGQTASAAPSGLPTTSVNAPAPTGLGIDSKSLEMLKEIKNDYNLSCETEALRMLIKIGFTKAKGFLK